MLPNSNRFGGCLQDKTAIEPQDSKVASVLNEAHAQIDAPVIERVGPLALLLTLSSASTNVINGNLEI